MAQEVDQKASKASVTSLQDQVDGKASASDLSALRQVVEGKASGSSVTDLARELNKKATSSAVEMLQEAIGQKASSATVDALRQDLEQGLASKASLDLLHPFVRYFETPSDSPRLGGAGRRATSDLDGDSAEVDAIETRIVDPALGDAIVVSNGYVAPIVAHRVEPGRQYRLRVVLKRQEDSEGPVTDAIGIGIRWLKADGSGLSTVNLANLLDVTMASGRVEASHLVGVDAEGVEAVPPVGAVYCRPFVRVFGRCATCIERIEWTDLFDAVDWSPDVSQFQRALAALDARQGGFEDRQDEMVERTSALALALDRFDKRERQRGVLVVSDDADITLGDDLRASIVRHTVPLSAPRTAALSTSSVEPGTQFRLVRDGGDAFMLHVGAGLKAMPSGSWADFAFDGAGWFVTASGSL